MNVSRNTVKQYVTSVLGGLGTRDRRATGRKLQALLSTIPHAEYRRLTRGLPKNWITNPRTPDPVAHLLAPARQSSSRC